MNFEKYIQKYWYKTNIYKIKKNNKKKFYTCSMIPYPSGKLHMGHIRNYTINDIIYRFFRMNGYNTFMPMGWDAFGLPAENAAIINKVSPEIWIKYNIKYMKKQIKNMGFSIDWTKEIKTCDPKYYIWNQWLFIKMFKKGLIYKNSGLVNWDPIDKTVLANEQVINKKGWRSGVLVKKKKISMYYANITRYSHELLLDINKLFKWPKSVCTMQKNWIKKKKSFYLYFFHKVYFNKNKFFNGKILIFLKNINHFDKIKYCILSYKHFLSKIILKINNNLNTFIKKNNKKLYIYTGIFLFNPIIGKKIPLLISNFNLKYNKTIILFFKNNYNIKNKFIINKFLEIYFLHLKDWCISRQRYWGTPIPIIYCKFCGKIPVLEKDLPVILPKNYIPNIKKKSLKNYKKFFNVLCYKCKNKAFREINTLDTFIDSSWYFMRYYSPNNLKNIINIKSISYWMPINYYIGGIEHAILHLLYSRFLIKVMRDLKIINFNEPFINLLTQGMVLNKTYYKKCKITGKKKWYNTKDIKFIYNKSGKKIAILKKKMILLNYGGVEKMSKSKNNGIDPKIYINIYSADIIRLFIIFSSPPKKNLLWSIDNIEGSSRFIKKLINFYKNNYKFLNIQKFNFNLNLNLNSYLRNIEIKIYKILKKINQYYKKKKYNNVVSSCMKILNILKNKKIKNNKNFYFILKKGIYILLILLYPIIPHITYKIWNSLGFSNKFGDILDAKWPKNMFFFYKYKKINLLFNNKIKNFIYIKKNLKKIKIKKKVFKYLFLNKIYNKPKRIIIKKNILINIII